MDPVKQKLKIILSIKLKLFCMYILYKSIRDRLNSKNGKVPLIPFLFRISHKSFDYSPQANINGERQIK